MLLGLDEKLSLGAAAVTIASDKYNENMVQELLASDTGPDVPAPLRDSSRRSFGLADLPIDRYLSKEFLALEYERVWSRVWQWACCEEDIPNVGDYTVYDIGDRSVIISRSAPDTISAFHNSCVHRGRQLQDRAGSCERFVCGYHNWAYDLEGKLRDIPGRWDFPQVPEDTRLRPVRLERWGGFIFLNFDDNARPLQEHLDVLPAHFEHFLPLEDRFTVANVSKVVPANWKVALEAFLESYHVAIVHPQIIEFTDEANTQYDVYRNSSRLITPFGVPSPYFGGAPTEDDIFERSISYLGSGGMEGGPDLLGDALKAEGGETLQPGETPRAALATRLRGAFKSIFGTDVSSVSDSEMIDGIEYFLFPNWCPWASVGSGLHYRFRPNGNDPDSSIFDVRMTMPLPAGGERPPAPPVHHLGPDEGFVDAPELFGLGPLLDQDYGNLEAVQRGMKAAPQPGLYVGDYQESRIRHFHGLLDEWLAE